MKESKPLPNTRIIFLTRRYPPSIGGIETHCFQLYSHLSRQRCVRLIALRRKNLLHLVWFIPYAFLTTLFEILFRQTDVIYFGDGVICSLATLLRPFSNARFVVTIYGLEMTYTHPLFSHLIKLGIARCDRVVVISENTKKIATKAGVPLQNLRLIYPGIKPLSLTEEQHQLLKKRFEEKHGVCFGRDRILLNYGRQVRRKGLAEFLQKGIPLLGKDIKLLIGGKGPELARLHSLRKKLGLQDRVFLLGWIDDETIAMLRSEANLFFMPNIRIPNDVEGFGIAPLECMFARLPVVAFAVDALPESIREHGYLIPENDYHAFVNQIHKHLALSPHAKEALRTAARSYVRANYSWEMAAEKYVRAFEERS